MSGQNEPATRRSEVPDKSAGRDENTTGTRFAGLNLSKHYGGVAAVSDVSIEFPAGSITAVVGDNGAGKSTLIKMLSGAIRPDQGHIELDGAAVRFPTPADAREAGIATVYQDLALADHRNVVENLYLGRELVRPIGPLRILRRAAMRRGAVDALSDLVKREMEQVHKLDVPLVADVHDGDNWRDLK